MYMTTGEKAVLGIGVFVAVIIAIFVIYAIGGLIFTVAWNFLMPSLWPAAPHFTWKMGVAAAWLIGIGQTIFGGGFKFAKKDD